MQSIPVPLQPAPPQPVPVAPLPVAPAPVAPPPVAPAPVIPPPAASEQPTFASLMPTPPPGIAPLLADTGFDFTRPSSAPPAAAAQESDSGSIRLSDLSALGEPPTMDPGTPAPSTRSGWPLGGPDTSDAFDGDPLNMTTSAFATESTPSAPPASSFSSDLSSLPRLSDIPKPPAELEAEDDFGRRSSRGSRAERSEHTELLNRSELSRSERNRADRNRSDRDPLNRSDLSASTDVEAEAAAESTRGRRASRTDDATTAGRTEGRRSARAEEAAAATPRASRTEIPRSERARTEIPRSERARTEIPRSERSRAERPVELPRQREGRVPPPWQTGDLPAEPAGLRLVEPAPVPDPALTGYSDELSGEYSGEFRFEPPALRLVEDRAAPAAAERATARSSGTGAGRSRRAAAAEASALASGPASASTSKSDEADGDLLIFAAARSAWFTDWDADSESEAAAERPAVSWENQNDSAWRAAEQASQPKLGDETSTGLPRRVPQQNLVPGAPVNSPERPLRIVRDAAQIAAHTTGYFRGWRRGQEVGGFSVGGRPGREAAGGWDFSREREASRDYQEREFEYRSARR
ncbi:hypothetical protein AB0J72_44290 [Dactylosporangium sp. NPDC049742]|uniref:hypothetical protein n=1 Tax=Dactylosporangium sp. NPDC049742 TaxID=3154737 RepID=UPI00343C7CFB